MVFSVSFILMKTIFLLLRFGAGILTGISFQLSSALGVTVFTATMIFEFTRRFPPNPWNILTYVIGIYVYVIVAALRTGKAVRELEKMFKQG